MSLLTVVQNAMTLAGLPVPSAAFSSTDDTVEQFIRLVYIEGRDLLKRYDWNQLIVVESLTCLATAPQTGYPVAAFERMAQGTDMWNTTRKYRVIGPATSEEWRDLITWTVATYPQYWRIIAGVLNIYAPVLNDNITYEYISNKWILQAGVTAATTLSADTDTFRFPENLMELGLVWRWKQSKQLDYAEDMRTYQIALDDAMMSDKGGRRVYGTDRSSIYDRPHKPIWPGTITG
jgi:hypothetical protein